MTLWTITISTYTFSLFHYVADIFNNLHAKFTKGSITKALDKLMEEESVLGKVYGKTTIYSIKQVAQDTNTTEDMATIARTIDDLSEQLEVVVTENKKLDQGIVFSLPHIAFMRSKKPTLLYYRT